MERLQKVIAASGLTSRRKAEELITAGRVKVNGVTVTVLGTQVGKGDVVTVDDKPLPHEELEYYLLNKPRKYVSTANDEHDRKKVTDLIDTTARIFPVGRLDYDSTGLIILTNDGEFANLLMHPRYHLPKMYHVTVKGLLEKGDVYKLANGVVLDDGIKTLPAKVSITNQDIPNGKTSLDITIIEGRNRQIRRMMEALGFEVTKLHRQQYGCVRDDQMPIGSYRRLKPHEIKTLREMALNGSEE
ncbi:MAG: rRNA pseudouridine synthase [Erysipelotrichaceae bacterium]|nr:rRNA pseudouridine synthase [Erysipelotrichaceae bacterium]MBQ1522203.1 rRNA pseudouridine synthase [Erysipelotrichaceae bacterium]